MVATSLNENKMAVHKIDIKRQKEHRVRLKERPHWCRT